MKKILLIICAIIPLALNAQEGTVITTGFVSSLVPPSPTNEQNGCIPTRTTEPDGRRLFSIYLPPNYNPSDSQTHYPVVYWCVGFNGTVGFNNEPAILNKVLLDMFINNGQMMPMIVVYPDPSLALTFQLRSSSAGCGPCPAGPDCHFTIPDYPADYASYGNSFYINSALNNVRYEDYFIEELIPYIDANYNTIADRNFRAITGHSMGGYAALLLGMRHPETFAAFAAESPTGPWMYTNPETWENPPAYNAFTLNSIMLPGLLDPSNPSGVASPCNNGYNSSPCAYNDFVFALAGALSPNPAGGTPFTDLYQVNLPIQVDANGVALLQNGLFDVVDFTSGVHTTVDQTVVLDPAVVAQWQANDPYFLLDTYINSLNKQAIYLDGGTTEQLNNVASRMISDKLMSNVIDNEYILYSGDHTASLFDPCCARNTTVFKMCSAQFAAAGVCAQTISCKLIGNLTINLTDSSQINIYDGTILSVQTSQNIPDAINPVSTTNVIFNLEGNGAIHIGTATQQGGALQIGDPFTKAQLQEYNTGPTTDLADHQIESTIHLNGAGALLEIGKQGFFGIGIGVTGKSNKNITHAPLIANFWSVTSLANLENISINLEQGLFTHNVISSGDQPPASLFGIDLSNAYAFTINPTKAGILGGGNMVCSQVDPSANPSFVNRQVRLLHPTLLNQGNTLPNTETLSFDPAAGIINLAIFQDNVNDDFINNPISTSTAYTNYFKRAILQSTPLFDRGDVINPFAILTGSTDTICDFLSTKVYEEQPIKLANISPNPNSPTITFLQNASFIDEALPFNDYAFPLIERRDRSELPLDSDALFDLVDNQGAIGVQIEYINSSADLPDQKIFNVKELIRIYNPHTNINN